MKWFELEEFACPCCGQNDMKINILAKLDEVREVLGLPIIIESGYRCEKHNSEIGSNSQNHTRGLAADLKCDGDWTRYVMLEEILGRGFTGVGIYPKSIHVDVNHDKRTCWYGVYPKKKKK